MNEKCYKASVFNYCVARDNNYLIYNTLYNSLVRLDGDEYLQYLQVKQASDDLIYEFYKNGIWVDAQTDEKKNYLACAKAYTLHIPRPLQLTITTTLKCNARCVYCYEKGVKQEDMFEGAEDKIIDFIRNNTERNEVHIVWFGGEPLLNTDFMDSLSYRLMEEGIKFSSYIISNGSLIDDLILNEKLALWNTDGAQITLDGTKSNYESRKRYINKDEGEFYNILSKIRRLSEKGVFINIRLNIDNENKSDILCLLEEIDRIYASDDNVVFYPAFITGTPNAMSEQERVDYIKQMLQSIHNIKKITAGTKFYSFPRMNACIKGDPYSFSIDVKGNVFTCEHYVGKEKESVGNIIDMEFEEDTRGKKIQFREECDNCVFLPKCFGGCESSYIEGDIPCMIEKYIIKGYLELL